MTKEIIEGVAFHCHHDTLVDYIYGYDERVAYIKEYKPKEEQELRLRLFQMIPNDRLPKRLIKALKAHNKAWDTFNKARDACQPELEKLHEELCPNCPWDGNTIFSGRKA